MSRDQDKLIRQLSLVSFLLSRPRPFAAREIHDSVEGYAEMSDDTFTRRFHGDRADLAKVGIQVRVLSGVETAEAAESQLYLLTEEDFHLPAVDFTPAEVRALSLALIALDGRFAYARPLRMALTAILRGRRDPGRHGFEELPVALTPDEDARRAGRQLSRLEEAVTRGKTVCFSYPTGDGGLLERTLDPYSLNLIQGHWYVVGHDHLREDIRMFRLGRIQGAVRFLTEKARDFSIPATFDADEYGARPPWMIGPVRGTALVKVGDDLAWWVERLQPHVTRAGDAADGCAVFFVPYADESVLLSWVVGLGGCGELLEPSTLREKLRLALTRICRAHEGEAPDGRVSEPAGTGGEPPYVDAGDSRKRTSAVPREEAEARVAPVSPEHISRAMALLYYLVDEKRPPLVTWKTLEEDLGLSRAEVEDDLSLINLVNYGGGTYALTAEAGPEGVEVVRDVMADTFARPARLSPVMARALLLALDLLGDTIAVEGLESLSPIREKVRALIGTAADGGTVVVDEVLPPDPEIVDVLKHAIRDHTLVVLDYYTASRQELAERVVEPYLLFHSPEGWYLEAYCLKAGEQRTFKLDRIRTARRTGDTFVPRAEIDLSPRRAGRAFFADDIATWATVDFDPRWRTYLEESGWEYRCRPDGRLTARLPYGDERWIALEIIRFLGDAVLLRPESARKRVAESALALLGRYESGPSEGTFPKAGGAAPPGGGS